jgi:hypothetical protein
MLDDKCKMLDDRCNMLDERCKMLDEGWHAICTFPCMQLHVGCKKWHADVKMTWMTAYTSIDASQACWCAKWSMLIAAKNLMNADAQCLGMPGHDNECHTIFILEEKKTSLLLVSACPRRGIQGPREGCQASGGMHRIMYNCTLCHNIPT